MIQVRQGDTKTFYVAVKGDTGTSIMASSAYLKFYAFDSGTYTVKGTATAILGTVYCQLSSEVLANRGTYQNHWQVTFPNNDQRYYIQDLEIFELFPTLPTLSYGSLTTLKRYVRNVDSNIKIGNAFSADVSEMDACRYILDAEDRIDGILKQHVTTANLPVSSPPDQLRLAASILGAYFLLISKLSANAPGEAPPAANSLKDLAYSLVDDYINELKLAGTAVSEEHGLPSFQKPKKAFNKRGVAGVGYGELDGEHEDEDITEVTS